ncbi:MAG: DUF3310 domain-containing protein [Desulfobacteraceae bacterium]|nr:DUF3310 domain-containing protein [Desulfobacteraceae bacterium]
MKHQRCLCYYEEPICSNCPEMTGDDGFIWCGHNFFAPRVAAEGCPDKVSEPKPSSDPTNPSHYRADVECIDAQRALAKHSMKVLLEDHNESAAAWKVHCQLHALKYVWRLFSKDEPEVNLGKMHWYGRMATGDDPRGDREGG